jgi:hypothetical protein
MLEVEKMGMGMGMDIVVVTVLAGWVDVLGFPGRRSGPRCKRRDDLSWAFGGSIVFEDHYLIRSILKANTTRDEGRCHCVVHPSIFC